MDYEVVGMTLCIKELVQSLRVDACGKICPGNPPYFQLVSPTSLFLHGREKGGGSNVKLVENIKALVDPQPTLREDSPVADLEKIQCYDCSTI